MMRFQGRMLAALVAVGLLAVTALAIQGQANSAASGDKPCAAGACDEAKTVKVAAVAGECAASEKVAATDDAHCASTTAKVAAVEGQCAATEKVAATDGPCAKTAAIAADAPCETSNKVAVKDDAAQCPVEAAMAELPAMQFKVGDEVTPCETTAGKMAAQSEQPIAFVVADQTYADRHQAMVALVESTESFVSDFAQAGATCPASGKTKVAGKDFTCAVKAGQYASLAEQAKKTVAITYAVAGETTQCAVTAGKIAEAKGEKMQYIVAGEQTPCELTARLKLAQERYKVAVKALVAADQAEQSVAADAENTGA